MDEEGWNWMENKEIIFKISQEAWPGRKYNIVYNSFLFFEHLLLAHSPVGTSQAIQRW